MRVLYNWYLVENSGALFLGGMPRDKSSIQIYEQVRRISTLTSSKDYYIIETKENIFRCPFTQENSSLHSKTVFDYIDESKLTGLYFADSAVPIDLTHEELSVIAQGVYNELSPEIIADISKAGIIEQDEEEELRRFIRLTALCYSDGVLPDNTEEQVYEELRGMLI